MFDKLSTKYIFTLQLLNDNYHKIIEVVPANSVDNLERKEGTGSKSHFLNFATFEKLNCKLIKLFLK